MSTDLPGGFISEGILQRLKETLQAQGALPQNDLSIQLSCMEASTSTLLEVKNMLDGLDKKTLGNVADELASADGHFILQRYLIKSYYFVKLDGTAAGLAEEGKREESRPPDVLIFCPLYVALMEVITSLLVSPMRACNIASTRVIQLLLKDLNVLVLPSPEPDQFKMLLANIHLLWELSKNPESLAEFRSFSDTVLILVNVFVSYQGPFEQLTTLVKSLAMIIAAGVANEETSIYLLAEETCLDFVVKILTKSVCAGEKYLNYHGVYAVDIAKCIENLGRFVELQEALLEKGVAELLVSMIQIGDPHDESAAVSALNQLMTAKGTVDEPVLLQGLVSHGTNAEILKVTEGVVSDENLSASKKEIGQGKHKGKKNLDKELLEEVQDESPATSKEATEYENVKIEHSTDAGIENKASVDAKIVTTETKPCANKVTSGKEELESTYLENTDYQEGNETETVKDNVEQCIPSSAERYHDVNYEEGIPSRDREFPYTEVEEGTGEANLTEQNVPPVLPSVSTMCTKGASSQEDVATYIRTQLEYMGKEQIKYIQIPTTISLDASKEPESVCKQPNVTRPFQHQQDGTDHLSGQELQRIHRSLVDLGVHNMYDEKTVSLLNEILEETKLREGGFFDLLNCVPEIYSYKMLRTGSMERQLRVVPAYNDPDLNVPVTHMQPEIDYHLVLRKFIFQVVPDHGDKVSFPGFTLIGPWCERMPSELEEWSFCFVPQTSYNGMTQFFLSADRLKSDFLRPILLSFASMNIQYKSLVAMGESLDHKNLKRHGITVRKIEENGPAVTVYYLDKYLTVDYVLSLRHIQWPSCATAWQDRQRHWPDTQTVKGIVDYGCHLVPKQPPTLYKDDPLYGLFFQYSFARAENVLLNKLNEDIPVLTDCLRMLKFLCELHFDRPQLLKSYHMQTIVLLAAERLPQSHWKANNFVKHVLDLLDDLLHYLVAHNLPNYFIPQQNLFEQFAPDFIWDVAARVSRVRRNPVKYLTPSCDPGRFGIYLI